MISVVAAPPLHFAWLYQRTGHLLSGSSKAIEAVDDEGRILGMVGYDDWTPNSVRMHVACDSPRAGLALVRRAFAYPFEQVGVSIALGVVASSNAQCMEVARSLGFVEVHRVKGGWSEGADLVFFRIDRRDCRWLQQHRKAA